MESSGSFGAIFIETNCYRHEMKLKTHTAYNEGQINKETNAWAVRIYDVHGKVLEQSSGKADSETAARGSMNAFVASVEPKYRKED